MKLQTWVLGFLGLALSCVAQPASAATAATALYFSGPTGEYVSQGQQYFLDVAHGYQVFVNNLNNAVKGYFSVLQAVYDAQGNVVEFAADFVLQGDTPGKIFGSVLYNSEALLV